ncbi:anthrone oxygenase family protein [Streptomyces sp. NPDC088194]|uniref:anthrone oxygenase family protein n=1 Tax=Streptomyces sp. NPDC088194 TaxID=3154931 RepID=UPI00344F7892
MNVVAFVSLFFAGLLAGAEYAVRCGVRRPLAVLADQQHIELRQALIRSLRIAVPAVYVPTLATAMAATVGNAGGRGFGFQCAGMAALLLWTVTTFAGTVPINAAVLAWRAGAPPHGWQAAIRRWERLDTVRTWAAAAAFACFLGGAARLASG